jgi:hypothetical protein
LFPLFFHCFGRRLGMAGIQPQHAKIILLGSGRFHLENGHFSMVFGTGAGLMAGGLSLVPGVLGPGKKRAGAVRG